MFDFPCNRWLSKTEDDGKISRDLILAGSSDTQGTTGQFPFVAYLKMIWPNKRNDIRPY